MTDPAIPAGTGVQITVGGFIRSPIRAAAPSGEGDGNPRLVDAAQAVLDTAQDYYTARDGRRCSIEGSDGEKCWIVPFDQFEDLRRAALSAPQGEVERLRAEVTDYRKLTREQQKRIGKLEGAIMARPPIKPDEGSWWYPEGDMSSDACCHGPAEALEAAADEMAEGEARVVVLERALELPDVYAALRVFTDAEKDARNDDDPWDFTLHATADEARAALSQSEAGGE